MLNRGLPVDAVIRPRVTWPIWLLPLLLIGQLLTPHPVWVTLIVLLVSLYAFGYFWVRSLAGNLSLERTRRGTMLVAGDTLDEEFVLLNPTHLPLLWAEFVDASELPDYDPSQVVAVEPMNRYRWHASATCRQRGVHRLGPARIITDDPFGLFRLRMDLPQTQNVLIYPRVLQLPEIVLPRGQVGGHVRRRRPLGGAAPATNVRDYQHGDPRRAIHWRSSAHRGQLMVRDLELEPSGDVWIVLDLNHAAHSGEGDESTLEYAIVLAASLTAALVTSSERRAVGLLTLSGRIKSQPPGGARKNFGKEDGPGHLPEVHSGDAQSIWLPPQAGRAQLWRVLAALAPVEPNEMPLAELLFRSREALGHRRTLIVITADLMASAGGVGNDSGNDGDSDSDSDDNDGSRRVWPAELVRLQAAGLASSVLLITAAAGNGGQAELLRAQLAGLDISAQLLPVGVKLPPALTYRRTRRVVRTTPMGGVVTYDVEEEVG